MSNNPEDALAGLADVMKRFSSEPKIAELIISEMVGKITVDILKNPSLRGKIQDPLWGEGMQYGLAMGMHLAQKVIEMEISENDKNGKI